METNYKGMNVVRDLPGQVEFNRRKNVEQDQRLSTLSSQVADLLAQEPAGYLPEVFYGIVPGEQTYRFAVGYEFEVESLDGTVGDSYELYDSSQANAYIPAIAVQTDETTLKIIIKGDYPAYAATLTAVNMKTGDDYEVTLTGAMTQQTASYLGAFDADDYKNKQITVLHDLESNKDNVLFCSIDLNSDDDYNWISIGSFTNGADGKCVYSINATNMNTILSLVKAGDSLVVCDNITIAGIYRKIGYVLSVDTINPLTCTKIGDIRGPQGETGATGATGANGEDGETPEIVNGYWYIGGVSTGVKAEGVDGTNGQDGKSFETQSGLYSTPDNEGQTGNVDPEGNPLLTLPTLPSASVEGKAYVVFDPLTTPLQPYYDMYWASGTDTEWTIIHPFNGINGQNGTDGQTPYIGQNGHWYIGSTDTGVNAQGPQGATGATGQNGADGVGIPSGGSKGQKLIKSSSTDYDTEWSDDIITLNAPSTDPVILYNLNPGMYLIKASCYYLLSSSDSSPRNCLITGLDLWAPNASALMMVSESQSTTNKVYFTFYGASVGSNQITIDFGGAPELPDQKPNVIVGKGSLTSTSTTWGNTNNTMILNTLQRYSGSSASFAQGLPIDNTYAYTPTADYHPATKKYVDDHAGGGGSTLYRHNVFMTGTNNYVSFIVITSSSTAINTFQKVLDYLQTLPNMGYDGQIVASGGIIAASPRTDFYPVYAIGCRFAGDTSLLVKSCGGNNVLSDAYLTSVYDKIQEIS